MFLSVCESFIEGSVLFFEYEEWELQGGIKLERSGSEECIAPGNMMCRSTSRPETAAAAVVDANKGDIGIEEVDENGDELIFHCQGSVSRAEMGYDIFVAYA